MLGLKVSNVDFDEFELEDAAHDARRMQAYSEKALELARPIAEIMIAHSRFKEAVHAVDRVFQLSGEVAVPYGTLLIGPPGTGKTALGTYYSTSLPQSSLFSPGYGIVMIRATGRPTSGQFVGALLKAYRYPFRNAGGGPIYSRRDVLFDLIKQKRTRLLFVDEAHRLIRQLKRGEHNEGEPEATQFLLDLMDECRIGLVLAGRENLDQLKSVDSHLADRVVGRHELTYFANDAAQWNGVLKGFCRKCASFDLQFLVSASQPDLTYQATGGSLRRLKTLLVEAVLVATDAGKQCLDSDIMNTAFIAIHGKDGARSPYATV